MDDQIKKLNLTGPMGKIFSLISLFSISISFLTFAGIAVFELSIKNQLVLLFLIIAVITALIGIVLGMNARKRYSDGKTRDGSHTGTNAVIYGFVSIGITLLLLVSINMQSGLEMLISREEVKAEVDVEKIKKELKEKIAATTEQLNTIYLKAKAYTRYMDEYSAPLSIKKFTKKYNLDSKDAWGNDIILNFKKQIDPEYGDFLDWNAEVSSAGPDGKPGTDDDVIPEVK